MRADWVATMPSLCPTCQPPLVEGVARLTAMAFAGADTASLLDHIAHSGGTAAAYGHDAAIAHQLGFRRAEGLALQDDSFDASTVFRVRPFSMQSAPLRLLALLAPGDLMVNTPLDFLTEHLDVRLDLLYLDPERALPTHISDHDVAFCAISEAAPALLARLDALCGRWPRPLLNHPRGLPALARDVLPGVLAGVPGLCSPPAVMVTRVALLAHLADHAPIGRMLQGSNYPVLVRPGGSHAGHDLARIEDDAGLAEYLRLSVAGLLCLTVFVDYRSADGLFRKYRIAFVAGIPHLCHMAVSEHWMVHYLNAGMTDSAGKRAQEAAAMASFEDGFARRHHAALTAVAARLGFDLFSIDCSETADGRLLVFEADTGAILHLMDPPDRFAYKQAPMRRMFAAFGDMLLVTRTP